MRLNLKKLRFVLLSAVLVATCYGLSLSYLRSATAIQAPTFGRVVVFIALISLLSSWLVQYLGGGVRDVKILLFTGIVRFLLLVGVFLFFVYFPSLSIILKLLAALYYFSLSYTLFLLNNVILVVESREVNIPVYRVAINWVQIVLLSISLVLFTGVYKTMLHPIIQVTFIMAASYVFYQYLIWIYSSDKENRLLRPLESVVISLATTILTGWGATMVLFFPTESFLRGIFVASAFLLGLGYIQLYLKNALSKKGIWDYLIITLVFSCILVIFRP